MGEHWLSVNNGVVGQLKLHPVISIVWMLAFTVFIFPTLYDTCRVANTTDVAPLIQVFPLIFLAINVILPIYLATGDR